MGPPNHCDLVKELWQAGHEIALHTRDHIRLDPPIDANKTDQILSVRVWLNETCGIPFEDMVGMRDPFLVNNPGTREVRERVQEFPCMCCVSACARAGDGGWLASPARWIRHECSQG